MPCMERMEERLAKLLERSRAETFDQRLPAKTRRRKRKHARQDSVESTKSATSELFTMHRDTLREVLHDGRSVNDLLDVVASAAPRRAPWNSMMAVLALVALSTCTATPPCTSHDPH